MVKKQAVTNCTNWKKGILAQKKKLSKRQLVKKWAAYNKKCKKIMRKKTRQDKNCLKNKNRLMKIYKKQSKSKEIRIAAKTLRRIKKLGNCIKSKRNPSNYDLNCIKNWQRVKKKIYNQQSNKKQRRQARKNRSVGNKARRRRAKIITPTQGYRSLSLRQRYIVVVGRWSEVDLKIKRFLAFLQKLSGFYPYVTCTLSRLSTGTVHVRIRKAPLFD